MVDLEERLRDLARAAEPSIRLAGPEAARARGHRRRARKRAALAASAVFTAAAIAIGSWQLTPGDDPTRTLPAAPQQSARTPEAVPDIPEKALLPPSALPFDASARWKTARTTTDRAAPLLDLGGGCRFTGLDSDAGPTPSAQHARSYTGREKEQQATHTINAYPDEVDAVSVVSSLEQALTQRCGLQSKPGSPDDSDGSGGSTAKPLVKTFTGSAGQAPKNSQVVLMRSGNHVAVVQEQGAGLGNEYTDGVSTHCMSVSLWRLRPSETPSPPPYRYNPELAQTRC
ncbi:hypothetical protein [Streptomyces sp. NPDC018031]|uniref:hypothetical protein n=1 Tax=Streptomyces sp. NPDC018031 TaxID=3365033 RepID=UPI0037986D76